MHSSGQRTGKSPAQTLADLLYAGGVSPTREQEWVELLRAIGAGDQEALHALYQRTHRIVFTLIARITNSSETAEEVTLDVFHDVWRRAGTYDPAGGTVVGWIMNQARSRAIDRVRFEQRKKRTHRQPDDSFPQTGTAEPQQAFDQLERGRLVRGAIANLTPAEREVIETAFFSGLTYAEVATRLELPLGTVKTRVRSGLDKLRQALGMKREEL